MKVYVVSEGCYSDYHNVCVVSDKAKAQELADVLVDGSFEEFDVDSKSLPSTPPGLKHYSVKMNRYGYSGHVRQADPFNCDFNKASEERCSDGIDLGFKYFYVWARDKDHAVKIANEKRTRMIALGEWQ